MWVDFPTSSLMQVKYTFLLHFMLTGYPHFAMHVNNISYNSIHTVNYFKIYQRINGTRNWHIPSLVSLDPLLNWSILLNRSGQGWKAFERKWVWHIFLLYRPRTGSAYGLTLPAPFNLCAYFYKYKKVD